MGLEQNILAVIAITLFINPKDGKKVNYFSIRCSLIAEKTVLISSPLKEMVHTLRPFVLKVRATCV